MIGGITWTDETWNPIRGCSKVSAGCAHCYAERTASRFSGPGMPYHGLAEGGRWTGDVRLVSERLADPLRWRKPRRIFVNSMSDLFHKRVDIDWIVRILSVAVLAPQHTFQILTKRPKRMRDVMNDRDLPRAIAESMVFTEPSNKRVEDAVAASVMWGDPDGRYKPVGLHHWPLPNVWLGVSVEDQQTADERIPLLLDTPAAVRLVSYEPAIGPVDFARVRKEISDTSTVVGTALGTDGHRFSPCGASGRGLDWIVVGGESGPKARPCHVDWIRSTVDQCRASGVPAFVKQMGSHPFDYTASRWPTDVRRTSVAVPWQLRDRAGADPAEWPEELRVREFPR